MPECVGDITDFLNVPKFAGDAMPKEEVAHKRFATYEEFVWKHIPGPNAQAPLTNEPFEDFAFLGPNLKIVLQDDRLRVEIEMGERRVSLQQIKQGITHID